MTADIQTMIWKESKGLFRRDGNKLRFFFTLLTPLLVIGIFLPWQLGTEWANSFWSLIATTLIPLLIVGLMIPETIAGERERHTLETLLASRLSDRVILFEQSF